MPTSARLDDLRTLWHLTTTRVRGETHAERLESFYAPQQRTYDAFRARMLHGRRELLESIDAPPNAVWIDFGAGTGENAEHLNQTLASISMLYLVDLCPALLTAAEERIANRGWSNVWAVCADATTFCPPERQADVVTFSYSLTMIPDWFRAIDHAYEILKPGGLIGVVDFYVSRKYPRPGVGTTRLGDAHAMAGLVRLRQRAPERRPPANARKPIRHGQMSSRIPGVFRICRSYASRFIALSDASRPLPSRKANPLGPSAAPDSLSQPELRSRE